jgi:hypothetical protein
MQCAQYSVYPASGGWLAHLDDREAGPYCSRDIALRVAIFEVLSLRKTGQSARVTVKDAGGNVCAERCLCERFGCQQKPA